MTVTELERKAWWLIALAKITTNKSRRKELMQEAFKLATRANVLRQLEFDNEELNGRSTIGDQGYGMRLSNRDGRTLWVYLDAESRADALWAANALGGACSDYFEDFDLWDATNHLLSAETKLSPFFFSDSAEEVATASQQSLLNVEETLMRSEVAVAQSRRLLEATAALRDRLAHCEN
jgi:hypothetical protein